MKKKILLDGFYNNKYYIGVEKFWGFVQLHIHIDESELEIHIEI